ncbi:hypothetical protein E4T56_gene477 [Termitomyces sp. T112]|nr:hypothetical protein E4T56_gene477 [Termitomyces sp. T112]
MLLTIQKTFTLTLLAYAALANAHIHRPNHVNLKRLIKKRASPQGDLLSASLVAGAAPAVPTFFSSSSSASDTASASVSSTSVASISAASTSVPVSTSIAHSSSPSESSTSTSSSVSETSISVAELSTSSSVSSTSSSTSTTSTPNVVVVTTSEQASFTSTPVATTTSSSKGIVTLTSSVDPSQSATVVPQTSGNTSAPKSTAVTALIVAASSVAAIAILWTVFRKWKLGHSSKFDERLQPIDWRPTTDDDGALPGRHRRHSGASSFRSAGHLPSNHGHDSSDHGHNSPSSYALPNHDFTAGPAHLAPVGGYADLARGPSPQPQMNQTGGATLARSAYDVGAPLHHQGYGSQDSYDYGVSRR